MMSMDYIHTSPTWPPPHSRLIRQFTLVVSLEAVALGSPRVES